MSSLFLLRRYGPLTLFKRNVLVDSNGAARLGGLGSAFSLSLPASWSDADAERLFCGIAPELINPQAFGLVHARTTKATDMFAFGMLAWEVSRFSACPPTPRYSLVLGLLRKAPFCRKN